MCSTRIWRPYVTNQWPKSHSVAVRRSPTVLVSVAATQPDPTVAYPLSQSGVLSIIVSPLNLTMPFRSDLFDLEVVDKAYGPYADLYVDVLRVSYLASDSEIQSAFFERRSEIFTVLSKLNYKNSLENDEIALSQRRFAERRMDAVVMAFRVLKGPESRKAYEKERERRIAKRRAVSPKVDSSLSPTMSQDQMLSPKAVQSFDDLIRPVPFNETSSGRRLIAELSENERVELSPRTLRKSRATPRSTLRRTTVSVHVLDTEQKQISSDDSCEDGREERSDRETSSHHEDEEEIVPRRRRKNEGVLEKISESPLVRTIAEEVHGVYLDTITAFDQVFNAFTLQEEEINAVCGRIEIAKRQLGSEEKRV